MNHISSRIFPDRLEGKSILRVDSNNNHTADKSECILVTQTSDGWKPVEQIERSIDRHRMASDFGFWQDREVSHTEGPFWNKHTVVDRPLDAKIDGDEIYIPRLHRQGDSRFVDLGGEIVKDAEERMTFHRQVAEYGSLYIFGPGYQKPLVEYINDDKNWLVSSK